MHVNESVMNSGGLPGSAVVTTMSKKQDSSSESVPFTHAGNSWVGGGGGREPHLQAAALVCSLAKVVFGFLSLKFHLSSLQPQSFCIYDS